MSKFLVETHYTCTFKIIHELDELNEKELSNIDNRKDGKVEIIDVTVNNRKTKKAGTAKKLEKYEIKNILNINHKSKEKNNDAVKSAVINETIKVKNTTLLRFPGFIFLKFLSVLDYFVRFVSFFTSGLIILVWFLP